VLHDFKTMRTSGGTMCLLAALLVASALAPAQALGNMYDYIGTEWDLEPSLWGQSGVADFFHSER
jgi:hypothetical protein